MARRQKRTRGGSGLSCVFAINKPSGMTSHDVVNKVRSIFNEKRVGHAGTLDPAASGVMLVFVGPAARLSKYLINHDKHYRARIVFGVACDTDDAQGNVLRTSLVSAQVRDENYSKNLLQEFCGVQQQLPCAYSAIKVNGKKACDEARRGSLINLTSREIEVFSARLRKIGTCSNLYEKGYLTVPSGVENIGEFLANPYWEVDFHVSSGTYIRALARDIGISAGSVAHLESLERTWLSNVSISDCVTLECLEHMGVNACIDPAPFLGLRVTYLAPEQQKIVSCGGVLPFDFPLFEMGGACNSSDGCLCIPNIQESKAALSDGEKIALIADGSLVAIYAYDEKANVLRADCIFSVGVLRGACI